MSLESDVAQVLRVHPVDRINFKVEHVAIDRTQMDLVAKAIDKQDISVVTGSCGSYPWRPIGLAANSP